MALSPRSSRTGWGSIDPRLLQRAAETELAGKPVNKALDFVIKTGLKLAGPIIRGIKGVSGKVKAKVAAGKAPMARTRFLKVTGAAEDPDVVATSGAESAAADSPVADPRSRRERLRAVRSSWRRGPIMVTEHSHRWETGGAQQRLGPAEEPVGVAGIEIGFVDADDLDGDRKLPRRLRRVGELAGLRGRRRGRAQHDDAGAFRCVGHRRARRRDRLVVAAPASGSGKTTVATGLMAALRRAGDRVAQAVFDMRYQLADRRHLLCLPLTHAIRELPGRRRPAGGCALGVFQSSSRCGFSAVTPASAISGSSLSKVMRSRLSLSV